MLLYNLGGRRGEPWRLAAGQLGIAAVAVHPSRYDSAIAALLRDGAGAEGAGPAMGFAEPMLLMAFFPEGMLDAYLAAAYGYGAERGILKAVLTPANALWSSRRLYGELQKERLAMHAAGQAKPRDEKAERREEKA